MDTKSKKSLNAAFWYMITNFISKALIYIYTSLHKIIHLYKLCKMVLACFVGVIVYNLFESTLLQNKVFLGMCEWIVICMGIVRNKELIKR